MYIKNAEPWVLCSVYIMHEKKIKKLTLVYRDEEEKREQQ